MQCVCCWSGTELLESIVIDLTMFVTGVSASETAIPFISPLKTILYGFLRKPPHCSTSFLSGVPIRALNIVLVFRASPETWTNRSKRGFCKTTASYAEKAVALSIATEVSYSYLLSASIMSIYLFPHISCRAAGTFTNSMFLNRTFSGFLSVLS